MDGLVLGSSETHFGNELKTSAVKPARVSIVQGFTPVPRGRARTCHNQISSSIFV